MNCLNKIVYSIALAAALGTASVYSMDPDTDTDMDLDKIISESGAISDEYYLETEGPTGGPTKKNHEMFFDLFCSAGGLKKIIAAFPVHKVKAFVNRQYEDGITLLHMASWRPTFDKLKSIPILLAAGADLNQQDTTNGNSPLHWATYCGCTASIKALLAANPDVNLQNQCGATPLHLLVFSDGYYPADYHCHQPYASSRQKPSQEEIAQEIAEEVAARLSCAQDLLAHGADPSIVDNERHSPLEIAVSKGHDELANMLFDALEAHITKKRETATLLASTLHKRIGAHSPMSLLPQWLFPVISRLAN